MGVTCRAAASTLAGENEVRFSAGSGDGSGGRNEGYSDEDEELIAKRLKALGYLE